MEPAVEIIQERRRKKKRKKRGLIRNWIGEGRRIESGAGIHNERESEREKVKTTFSLGEKNSCRIRTSWKARYIIA